MKINKDFAVIVGGECFEAFDILEIHIDGGKFKMICENGREAKKIIECRTRDVEFVSVSPLGTMKQAFDEAIKEMGNTPKTIQVGLNINGEQFAKAIKPGDSIRETVREVIREIMTEDAIESIRQKKLNVEIDAGTFEALMKKYNKDQARRSGGD